jgi:hypothetical protein
VVWGELEGARPVNIAIPGMVRRSPWSDRLDLGGQKSEDSDYVPWPLKGTECAFRASGIST